MLKTLALYMVAVSIAVALAACCCPMDDFDSSKKPTTKKRRSKKKKKLKPSRDIIGRWKCDKLVKTEDGKTKEENCSKQADRFDLKITQYFRYDFIDARKDSSFAKKLKRASVRGAYGYATRDEGKGKISLHLNGSKEAELFRFKDRDTLIMVGAGSKNDGVYFKRTQTNPKGPLFPVKWVMDRTKETAEKVLGEGDCNKEANILVCHYETYGPFETLKGVYEKDRMVGLTVDLKVTSNLSFENEALAEFEIDVVAPNSQNQETKTWKGLHDWDEVRLMSVDNGKTVQRLRIQNYTIRLD